MSWQERSLLFGLFSWCMRTQSMLSAMERASHGGKTTKTLNTSNLVTNLKKKADLYSDYLKRSGMMKKRSS